MKETIDISLGRYDLTKEKLNDVVKEIIQIAENKDYPQDVKEKMIFNRVVSYRNQSLHRIIAYTYDFSNEIKHEGYMKKDGSWSYYGEGDVK